ncbi:hypothetical protein BV20DRAFT_982130 [Pilatotrama ljubarskyi]|nr:hypothetical protein BV20DRAFT_982130 [Pilatotrama ljubarskyi]
MFTTLITFFLTVLGALRATPLYYHILTLGDGLRVTSRSWFSGAVSLPLLEKTATSLGNPTGNGILVSRPPLVLTLPASPTRLSLPPLPLLLTLPAGSSTYSSLYPELVLLLAYLSGFSLVLGGLFWHLRATLCETCGDCERQSTDCAVVFTFGSAYSGKVYESSDKLAGIPDSSEATPTTSSEPCEGPAPSEAVIQPITQHKRETANPSKVETTSPTAPVEPVTPPPPAPQVPTATLHASAPLAQLVAEDDEGPWSTWTNKRKRRPPRRPPPPSALSALPSRSSSVLSTSRTSDTLFSAMSSTSTAPTSVASSRRFSTTVSSPHKPTRSQPTPWTRSRHTYADTLRKSLYNRLSVLEVDEAGE